MRIGVRHLIGGTAAALALSSALPAIAMAEEPPAEEVRNEQGEIVVFGRGEGKIGVAGAASEGSVAGSDLLVRPLLRVAELLEAVPGMVAAQHSGSGKANQYFLRGFNLDHGSDFTTYIDGVQMNLRTHGHGQGYLDLNGLIPEVIEREDYRKGPYRADGGDFALAGAAYMKTVDRFDRPWAAAELGMFDWVRVAAGGTVETPAGGALTLVGQVKTYNGPWQEAEKLRHYAGFLKYTVPTALGNLGVSVHGYRGTWRPTEQIPERIIGSPTCKDAFCSPDPTARGETTRFVANAQIDSEDWKGNVYGQYYDWSMSSNPVYANADGSSAQIRQFDRRFTFGLVAEKRWAIGKTIDLRVGSENRFDDIDNVGVENTDPGDMPGSLGFFSVKEGSASLYAEATWRGPHGLRAIGGLRGDYYNYDVRARDPAATASGSGSGHDSILSPKLALAWAPIDSLEFYANWGHGFHSNDVRGAVNEASPVPVLVRGKGKEIGTRFQTGSLTLTATYFWLDVASELRFVGDSNAVEPSGASRRRGYELVAFARPWPWLAIDANYTASHSRYDNGDEIPNAFENAAAAGISILAGDFVGSVRMRHLGPYPLTEDGSVRDDGSTVFNLRGAWRPGRWEFYAELLNVFDSDEKDIAYYYESYIPAFDAAPVDGRLSRVVEPRTLRAGIKYQF